MQLNDIKLCEVMAGGSGAERGLTAALKNQLLLLFLQSIHSGTAQQVQAGSAAWHVAFSLLSSASGGAQLRTGG